MVYSIENLNNKNHFFALVLSLIWFSDLTYAKKINNFLVLALWLTLYAKNIKKRERKKSGSALAKYVCLCFYVVNMSCSLFFAFESFSRLPLRFDKRVVSQYYCFVYNLEPVIIWPKCSKRKRYNWNMGGLCIFFGFLFAKRGLFSKHMEENFIFFIPLHLKFNVILTNISKIFFFKFLYIIFGKYLYKLET